MERHASARGLLSFGRREGAARATLRTDVEHWQRELADEQVSGRLRVGEVILAYVLMITQLQYWQESRCDGQSLFSPGAVNLGSVSFAS